MLHCPHCNRDIPEDVVSSFDTSGCPLIPPCPSSCNSVAAAWPREEDDDDGEVVGAEPVLIGPVAD